MESPDAPLAFTIDQGDGGQPQKRAQLTLDQKTGEVVRWEPFSSYTTGRKLRSFLRFAAREGRAPSDLARALPVPSRRRTLPDVLSAAEAAKLCSTGAIGSSMPRRDRANSPYERFDVPPLPARDHDGWGSSIAVVLYFVTFAAAVSLAAYVLVRPFLW